MREYSAMFNQESCAWYLLLCWAIYKRLEKSNYIVTNETLHKISS